jgi:hypothetical protein
MATKVIRVDVSPEGIRLDRADHAVGLKRGRDKVRWAVLGPQRIEIEFENDTPFDARILGHEAATGRDNQPTAECARGRYKYTIYEEGNRGNKLDPHIIIDPPSSGGFPGGG